MHNNGEKNLLDMPLTPTLSSRLYTLTRFTEKWLGAPFSGFFLVIWFWYYRNFSSPLKAFEFFNWIWFQVWFRVRFRILVWVWFNCLGYYEDWLYAVIKSATSVSVLNSELKQLIMNYIHLLICSNYIYTAQKILLYLLHEYKAKYKLGKVRIL